MINIITINKNNKNGLLRTINSILEQINVDFKWTIIDGNSTDGSKEIIQAVKFNNLKVIIEDDQGIYDAMNKGIENASEDDYLWFVNSGDTVYNSYVIRDLNELNFQGDILYGNYLEVTYNSDSLKEVKKYSPSALNLLWLYKKPLNHQCYMIRGQILKQFPFDITYRICADWVQFFSIYWKNVELDIYFYPVFLVRFECGGFSSINPEKYYFERDHFLNSIFSNRVNQDFHLVSSILTKKEANKILRISRSKYSWILLRFILKFFK